MLGTTVTPLETNINFKALVLNTKIKVAPRINIRPYHFLGTNFYFLRS